MQASEGFIPFYYDSESDKVYLHITQFNQPLIFQTSLAQGMGSNDIGLDRGQLGETRLVQFERFGNKILLKQLNTTYRATTDNQAERDSIQEAFADSVIAGFALVAGDANGGLIDYTGYLLSDVHGMAERLSATKQGSFRPDPERSGVYLARTKGFELNTELEALVTFGGSGAGDFVYQVTPDPTSISVHLHHSFVALPESGYQPRAYHPYSGYWKVNYFDYATPITEPTEQKFISRHRLLKKDPEAAISEPVEPIIYYLDPGTPEPIRSALMEGALWWNQAFEAIGYEDAFQVKMLPEGADPMDLRYNIIQWVHRATRGWSYGSSVVDPRTGEIIKGKVTLGSLRVRQDYLIALGLTSPFNGQANTTDAQKQMALARIRQLSAHEVGHTLGIAHNFAASENGRESVMDYPHPKITLKNGEIVLDDAYATGMGEWDKHAVAYGYQDYLSGEAEAAGLARQISQTRSRGLKFKTDVDTRASFHASSDGHMWDNGDDPLKAFEQIASVRKRALEQMGLNSIPAGASLSSLEDVLVPIYLLHRYQLEAVVKQVGGLNYEYERKGDYTAPQGQSVVQAEIQKKAMALMIDASSAPFLTLPDTLLTLLTPTAFGDDVTREHFQGRMGRPFDPVSAAESAAYFSLSLVLQPERLNRLSWQSSRTRGLPGVGELVERIFDAHWYSNSANNKGVSARLQLVALNAVMQAVANPGLAPEARLAIQNELMSFETWLKDDAKVTGKGVLLRHLSVYWQTGQWPGDFEVKPLPPGSPI
ncbi:DUF5117 domain-containing protein [Alteromonas aestuariivivens]|uniref:DUF5117 domain-containing protein n=1 Tax=Alteromonas aestuariivivens TaxID=1938339 RepID=A0A3D8M4G6_9ALTE|nr:zinc-dependent metalloprotease [Alteromonas aestuariivivens]RDV24531.1 DUF5117 domain-containing protein [Alteromonas aestuariivivens]